MPKNIIFGLKNKQSKQTIIRELSAASRRTNTRFESGRDTDQPDVFFHSLQTNARTVPGLSHDGFVLQNVKESKALPVTGRGGP
jgi:hypothetical protein